MLLPDVFLSSLSIFDIFVASASKLSSGSVSGFRPVEDDTSIASLGGGSWELYFSSLLFNLVVLLGLPTALPPPNNGLAFRLLLLGLNLVALAGGRGTALGSLFLVDGPSCFNKASVWNIFAISSFANCLRTHAAPCS